jgi:hypothetical protein
MAEIISLETASLEFRNNLAAIDLRSSLSDFFCLVTDFIGIRKIIFGRLPPIKV